MKPTVVPVLLGVLLGVAAFWWLDAIRESQADPRIEAVECWFKVGDGWPTTRCYYMHVPERHDQPEAGMVAFPVVHFKSGHLLSKGAPVLHLGAGGPGAPMYLDSTDSVHATWLFHDAFSLQLGRDLYVIDPRGSGLSKPLLTCQTYVDNVRSRWSRSLSRREEWREIDQDYFTCVDRFRAQGVDFDAYNSRAIAHDVELLRRTLGVERWVLVGVSYAATYAQVVFREFPSSVEAMILDSATFPNLKGHHNYRENTLAPFKALLGYCEVVADCEAPIDDLESRFWGIYDRLQAQPIKTEITDPEGNKMPVIINGNRFLAALMEGIYGTNVFADLPKIIAELEYGHAFTLRPYIEDHLSYLLDETYGDVSTSAHYCHESKPFTDFDVMRQEAKTFPEGYIRDVALFSLDWPDYCERMRIEAAPPVADDPVEVTIPTLFLHGELDTVTRLHDVLRQRIHFPESVLKTFPVSHAVLSASDCAEILAGRFVASADLGMLDLSCPSDKSAR